MRIPHFLVRSPSGIYHFRMKVPVGAQAALGLRVIKRSLRTTDGREALIQAYLLGLRYAEAFAQVQGSTMPKPPPLSEILRGMQSGNSRSFELDIDPVTRAVTRLKTDGSEQDNLAALAALKVVFASPLPERLSQRAEAVAPAVSMGMTVGEALRLYEATEADSMVANTWAQRQRAMQLFVAYVKPDTPVRAITRPTAAAWSHDLMARGMSKRTAANSVSHVAQLFEMLIARGEIERGQNPVKGVLVMSKKEKVLRRKEGFTWEPFELPVLKQLFDPENFRRLLTGHARWAPFLGLYTGARVGEIAQLYLRDFVEETGVRCVRITDENDGQTVKTLASTRLVPLHPVLLELGLWERVERLRRAGHDRLFPYMRIDSKAGTGNAVSKAFSYYLDALGITARRENGIVGFHSLRKNVVQSLQAANLPAERRRAFVGHETGEDVHEAHYMRPWTPAELKTLFPGLPWGEWLDVPALKAHLWSPERGQSKGD